MELLSSSSSRSSAVPGAAASIISPGHRSSKALGLLAGTPAGPRSHRCGAARRDPLAPQGEGSIPPPRARGSPGDSVFPRGLCQAPWRDESRGRGALPSREPCDASQQTHAHVGVGRSAEAKRSVPSHLWSQPPLRPPDLTPRGGPHPRFPPNFSSQHPRSQFRRRRGDRRRRSGRGLPLAVLFPPGAHRAPLGTGSRDVTLQMPSAVGGS